jgi:hypothetical protein
VLAPLQRRNTFVRIFPIVESWNSHLLYLWFRCQLMERQKDYSMSFLIDLDY